MADMLNLLWTGGWDSTFRLLYALIIEKQKINPFYIYFHERKSRDVEIRQMNIIMKKIKKLYPEAARNISNITIVSDKKLQHNKEIDNYYESLISKYHVGKQYRWLAAFAESSEEEYFEVAIARYFNRENSISAVLLQNTVGTGGDCKLKENLTDKDLLLFRKFKFPTLHLTKPDMEKIAREKGFMKILDDIWFCHRPRFNYVPCGKCVPCKLVVESGLAFKLPLFSLFFYFRKYKNSSNIFKVIALKKESVRQFKAKLLEQNKA